MFKRAFTLVELLVVIGIISILASTVVVNVSKSRNRARDARRKADLKTVQTSLETFNDENGSYPTTINAWVSEVGNANWIPGLIPNFLVVLPTDPTRRFTAGLTECSGITAAGYAYRSDGTNYKLIAACTVETTVQPNDPFRDPAGRPSSYAIYSSQGISF